MTRRWTPPTTPALARWARLLADAQRLIEHPAYSSGDLMRSLAASRKDPYPTKNADHWRALYEWMKAAQAFAEAAPEARGLLLDGFQARTALIAGLIAPPEPMMRFSRRDE